MTERKGIQLCYPFEEKRLTKWTPPFLVQPKLDGERCRAICDHGEIHLLSSSEQEIVSVPHINEDLSRLFTNSPRIELDGELYCHGLSFDEIQSRVSRTANYHPEYGDITYHVFDVVNSEPQLERLYRLYDLCLDSDYIRKVPSEATGTLDEVMEAYQKFISEGYEGIVIRDSYAPYIRRRSTQVMKFKPKKSDYYKIVGVGRMIDKNGEPKDMLGYLICESDGQIFSVGSGMNDSFRKQFFPMKFASTCLVGKFVHVQYQHLTAGKGVPRFPVFVEIINPAEEL
jgi:ATP-dependent DNA ligase